MRTRLTLCPPRKPARSRRAPTKKGKCDVKSMTKPGRRFSFAQAGAWALIASFLAITAPARAETRLENAVDSHPIAVAAPSPRSVAAVDDAQSQRQTGAGSWVTFPGFTQGCNGVVYAMASGPDGRIAVGGSFSICGGIPANNVAIYDPTSDRWSALGGGVTAKPTSFAEIYTLAWFKGQLFVGGEFSHAGGMAIADLARWDGNGWRGVGLSGIGTTTHALAASDTHLYAGGAFEEIGGVPVRGMARWARWLARLRSL